MRAGFFMQVPPPEGRDLGRGQRGHNNKGYALRSLYCEASVKLLGFTDGFVRAGAFAGAAVDALVGVDYIGAFALGDGAHRAYIGAGAAGDTNVGIDLSCHSSIFLLLLCFVIDHKFRHYI